MGARGPKKEPAEVKDRKGTRKKSRDPDPVPVAYGLPACPFAPASEEAKSWDRLITVMRESQLDSILTSADTGTLEAAAVAWCRSRQASAAVAALSIDNRYVHTKSNGLRPHPAIAEERAAWSDFRRFASDLGLSPSARSSIGGASTGGGSPEGDMDALTRALLEAGPVPVEDD